MYTLFEIPDKYLIIFGVSFLILLLIIVLITFILKKKKKVKPIEEEERFEEEVSFKKIDELTDEQKKAREELERVFNQMNNDLQKEKENVVDSFEREQEENAIISYQELIKQVQSREENNVKEKVNIPEEIALEKEKYLDALENIKPAIEERKPYAGDKTKFNASEIISPIYGRQEPKTKEETEEEKKQNEEFLNTLKEFRNNL